MSRRRARRETRRDSTYSRRHCQRGDMQEGDPFGNVRLLALLPRENRVWSQPECFGLGAWAVHRWPHGQRMAMAVRVVCVTMPVA